MKLRPITLFLAACLLSAPALHAQDKPKSEPIYGYSMMTSQERDEYRARMREAKSAEERERIRAEHHERMKERAKERGITLPDKPPAGGGVGMGPGGMGPGGMGPGGMGRGK